MNKKGLSLVIADFINSSKVDHSKTGSTISIILCNKPSIIVDIVHAYYGKSGSVLIKVNRNTNPNDLLASMFPQKKAIFLSIKEAISNDLYQFLKNIAENKQIITIDISGNPVVVPTSSKNHLFIVSKKETLESQHGNLINLSVNVLDVDTLL